MIFVGIYAVVVVTKDSVSRYYFNWDTYMFSPTHRRDITAFSTLLNTESKIRIAVFILIVATLAVSTVLTVIKLFSSIEAPGRSQKEKKRTGAIKTTILLALTSILFNGYVIVIALIGEIGEPQKYPWWSDLFKSAIYLALPLNSALNPGIYFVRIRDIRLFWWGLLSKTTTNEAGRVLSNPVTRPSRVSSTV